MDSKIGENKLRKDRYNADNNKNINTKNVLELV